MKIRLDRDVIAEAVQWAARSLPNRPSQPILAGLRVEASGNEVVLSSFDYETSARVTVPAQVEQEGAGLTGDALPARLGLDVHRRQVGHRRLEGAGVAEAEHQVADGPAGRADQPGVPELVIAEHPRGLAGGVGRVQGDALEPLPPHQVSGEKVGIRGAELLELGGHHCLQDRATGR